jgi:dipeptidyl aminopeptidase/acylaminoacyl peptidase
LDTEREVTYAQLTWGNERDEPSADALAVLKGGEDEDLVEQVNALLLWPAVSESQDPVVLDPRPKKDSTDAREPDDFPEGWVLSEGGSLRWSHDASRVFVATKPQLPTPKTLCKPEKEDSRSRGRASQTDTSAAEADTTETKADSAKAEEPKIWNLAARFAPGGRPLGPEEVQDSICPEFVADVDIWHVGDERIQAEQIVRASRDRNRTYQSVVHVEGNQARFVQLADTTMESLQLSDDGLTVMGRDDRPYRSDWLPSYADYYRVDPSTGERTLVLEKHLRTMGFSPNGEHYLYWKDGQVWSYNTEDGSHANLTQNASVSFTNEEFDRMGEKPPYGVAGWPEGGESVILNHKYDLYLQPLDGSAATNLTRGVGAEGEIRFRIIDLEPDEEEIDMDEPLLMTAYGQWTKRAGFYRLEGERLEALVMDDARFGRPQKADSTDVVLFTKEDFETFPDYYTSGLDFSNPVKVTDTNPQQSEFNWGRRILFDYETHDGVRLQGTLAIPYDYVEGEKRPMLINFYEKNSQNLHSYPRPGYRSSPNFAGYVSAGYLVMQPDIHFRLGPSHGQMLECIDLAVDKVVEMGYLDPEKIGIHGHSYSGQGAAYISTHSDRYAAVVAGAAASNLVSDFNQLWKSSGTNQHGYDTYGQGRFATNPYDDFELFVDQSAAQNADQMNTNLLLLHGTDDGSVEWLQAVEFYNGVRWNGGNVILLSYPGEGHGLRKYENQKDFQIRMRQFFDHHLWGKPAPRWMESGRSFLQKGRDLEMMEGRGNGGGRGAP